MSSSRFPYFLPYFLYLMFSIHGIMKTKRQVLFPALLTGLLLIFSGSIAIAQLNFTSFSEMPKEASGMSYCSDGHHIYAFNGANPPLSSAWKYDPVKDEWTVLSEKLSKKWGANAVHIPGTEEILIFNGRMYADKETGTKSTQLNTRIESFNTRTGEIRQLGENPYPRYGAGAAWHQGKIIVFGGANSVYSQKKESYSAEVFEMDPQTLAFEKLTELPEPSQTQGAIIDEVLYVIGGYQAGISLATIYAFNLKTGQWSDAGEAPHGLSGHTVTQVGSELWILGGTEDLYHAGRFKTCSWEYESMSANLFGRKFAGTAVAGDMLFTFGGNQKSPCHDLMASVQGVRINGGEHTPQSLEGPGLTVAGPPENGIFPIRLETRDAIELSVSTLDGDLLLVQDITEPGKPFSLDLSHLDPGPYLATVYGAEGQIGRQILVR